MTHRHEERNKISEKEKYTHIQSPPHKVRNTGTHTVGQTDIEREREAKNPSGKTQTNKHNHSKSDTQAPIQSQTHWRIEIQKRQREKKTHLNIIHIGARKFYLLTDILSWAFKNHFNSEV